MRVEHNSRLAVYRDPFGSVTCGTKVRLRLALTDFGIPKYVHAVTECGGDVRRFNMAYVFELSGTYFYETEAEMPSRAGQVRYYFDIGGTVFYGNNAENTSGKGEMYDGVPNKMFRITVYEKSFDTPEWWRTGVCYQIFPDRFYNGNENGGFCGERTDIIKRKWGEEPYYKAEQFGGKYTANDFFGGNLKGVEQKLSYLKDLGISCIYLNPIFEAYSNHRYDTGDYEKIDSLLGDESDFARLCKSAEDVGIRIILDGVFNHTGSDSRYFNKNGRYSDIGAYQSEKSPYYGWYEFKKFPDEYESWWGIDTLPQTNEENADFQKYILTGENAVVKKWLKLGASGWRLDVVDELPDFFVEMLRKEVKKCKPDAVIIGEVWEDASDKVAYGELRRYFSGGELDSVMNYPLRGALVDFVMGKIDAEKLDERIMSLKEGYPRPAFYAAMNFLSSHDVERILTVMGGEKAEGDARSQARMPENVRRTALERLECAVTMQMLLPGVPTVFYGDEVGAEGYADPFCRACFPWDNSDGGIYELYKKTIGLRNGHEEFKNGEFETLYKRGGGYGFVRIGEGGGFAVLVNVGEEEVFRVDAARFGMFRLEGVFHDECSETLDGVHYINMKKNSVKVFKDEDTR